MSKNVTRLFSQFQPERYELQLHPDPSAMTFSGHLTLTGKKVGRPSQRVTLHQNGLTISDASIVQIIKGQDTPVAVSRINTHDSYDELRLHSDQKLVAGVYRIELSFSGTITKQMDGMYPCLFTHNGVAKKLIATQFESHDARKVFPCIDEPEAKAVFHLTLRTPQHETVISNTPVELQSDIMLDGKPYLQTSFQPTPRMSTYLVAFAFGELGYREATTKDGVLVRAYATPDNVALTEHGLAVAVKALEFFGEYFGVPYPLPKLDMIALPDFSSGAMENWGLVTYRETTMLADDASSSIETKQLVALVICHELSHQWFGNLVTMQWWNDLWLNESFANMMEHRAIDTIYPDWNIWEQFVATETASAKRRDSLSEVQPIRLDVHHPDEIATLFDPSIVYAKGGTVLYMLMHYIGEAAFRAGLQDYFAKHAYGNTTADDLWRCLSAQSKKDVGAFMADWLNRPGYPIVSIDWTPGSPEIQLEQRRFLSDAVHAAETSQPWMVPLHATAPLDNELFTSLHGSAILQVVPDDTNPLLFNHDGQSYYLPYYRTDAHLLSITAAIAAGRVDPIDRLLLLDNYIMLQRGGESTTTELLELLPAYKAEQNENVWGLLSLAIGDIRRLVEGKEVSERQLDSLVGALVLPTVARLGWDDAADDTPQTLHLRGLALSLAAGAKVSSVLDEATQRFSSFTSPADLAATIRSVVYYAGVRYGSAEDFRKLIDLHASVVSADERDEIAAALTSAKDPVQHQELLGMMSSDAVRRQDLLHWYVWMLRNRYARVATWDWMKSHWEWIETELRGDKSYSYFPRYAGSVFSHPDELAAFDAFFAPKTSDVALSRAITLGSQEIASRVDWRARNEASVIEWLDQDNRRQAD
jgi:aminopeptidase N